MTQNETLQHVLDNQTTAVLLLDESFQLKYINTAGEMLFAASARQVLGTAIQSLIPNAGSVLGILEKSHRSRSAYTEHGIQLVLRPHHTVTVDCSITPLNERGRGKELLLELLQIDRHMRIAREEQLLDQYQNTRLLLRGLAHEIKNPLGGLRGAAQLLEKETGGRELKEYTDIIIGESDRLQNLLNRILGPRTLPKKENINIHKVLENVRLLVQAETPENISISRDYDPSIPDIFIDEDQLFQAVLNITRNAMQALGQAGEILIRTRTQRHFTLGQNIYKLAVQVEIIDNGPGIPDEMIEKIFYPMITSRPEGTGLGLTIAQSLVNQHNGIIECTSQPGETLFRITLPLEQHHE
ncbi:MAG: nitrogen regulation protein NR(II) [Gammaproteobacteria bacterium]